MNEYAADRMTITISEWREAWAQFLNEVHVIRAFSRESSEIFCSVFPECSERVAVQGHRIQKLEGKVSSGKRRGLVLGVVGNINHAKGGTVVSGLVRQGSFPVVIVGKFSAGKGTGGRLKVHGEYRVSELHELIDRYGITIGFVPSVWPETYNFVADELMSLGLPVVCFDVGAHAGRVREYARGHLLPLALKDDPVGLATCLERIHGQCSASPSSPAGMAAGVHDGGGDTKQVSVS